MASVLCFLSSRCNGSLSIRVTSLPADALDKDEGSQRKRRHGKHLFCPSQLSLSEAAPSSPSVGSPLRAAGTAGCTAAAAEGARLPPGSSPGDAPAKPAFAISLCPKAAPASAAAGFALTGWLWTQLLLLPDPQKSFCRLGFKHTMEMQRSGDFGF